LNILIIQQVGNIQVEVYRRCTTQINYFTDTFGKLPYLSVSIAETRFLHGGMEYSGLCTLSKDLTGVDFQHALIHEIAHQWWHGAVSNNQFQTPFIDEGLAELGFKCPTKIKVNVPILFAS
jgi:hypothetical protein